MAHRVRHESAASQKADPAKATYTPAPSLAVAELLGLQRTIGNAAVSRLLAVTAGARIQRVVGYQDFDTGRLSVTWKPEAAGDVFGEAGDVTFNPKPISQGGSKATSIELVQAVKVSQADGGDYAWGGTETIRELTKTAPGGRGEANYYIDRLGAQPRATASEPAVRPEYNQSYPKLNPEEKTGANLDKYRRAARLYDHAGANRPMKWDFQTTVMATTEYNKPPARWATALFGFETERRGSEWNVKADYVKFEKASTDTMEAALREFDLVYRNPGARTSPESQQRALDSLQDAKSQGRPEALKTAKDECDRIAGEFDRIAKKPTPFKKDTADHVQYEKLTDRYARWAEDFRRERDEILAGKKVLEKPGAGMKRDADDLRQTPEAEEDEAARSRKRRESWARRAQEAAQAGTPMDVQAVPPSNV